MTAPKKNQCTCPELNAVNRHTIANPVNPVCPIHGAKKPNTPSSKEDLCHACKYGGKEYIHTYSKGCKKDWPKEDLREKIDEFGIKYFAEEWLDYEGKNWAKARKELSLLLQGELESFVEEVKKQSHLMIWPQTNVEERAVEIKALDETLKKWREK